MKLKKNILISGAGGYIALHLAKMLRQEGYNIIKGTKDEHGDFCLNFSNPQDIRNAQINDIDVMIHTVSPNEELYKIDPCKAITEHLAGMYAALDFCINNNICDFIYFSSFHVFGKTHGRIDEKSTVSPNNDYGLAHCVAEQVIQMYARNNKINGWIIRPSNVYGIPVVLGKFKRWNLIPFAFCREVAQHKSITLLTSGSQLRNFIGINDLCRKVKWVIEKRPKDMLWNAYGSETMSVFHFAKLIQNIADNKFDLTVNIKRPEGVERVTEFDYTSLYKNKEIDPIENLEDFIIEMLTNLLN